LGAAVKEPTPPPVLRTLKEELAYEKAREEWIRVIKAHRESMGQKQKNVAPRGSGRVYKLIGKNGLPYFSIYPGLLGGHSGLKIYGRLDCPSALRWIAKGHYVEHRVFFASIEDAEMAGYRPCKVCKPLEGIG
jgi:hypothetical protein